MSSQKGRIRTALLTLVASFIDQGHGYSTLPSARRKPNMTQRRYLPSENGDIAVVTGDEGAAFVSADFFTNQNDIPSYDIPLLPTWLQNQDGDRAAEKLYELYDAMEQYLSEHEAHTVQSAIHKASDGDPNKMAGAAEFCLILVETTEMGVDTLVAAAFHYCACVVARETSSSMFAESSVYYWDEHYDYEFSYGIEVFSEGAVEIAHNSAKLKRAEMIAASVMLATGSSNHVAPDSNDADNLRKLLLSETADWRALGIRAAACLYRLRGLLNARALSISTELTPEEVAVSREAFRIYAPLASQLGMHRLKNEIEGAAFQLLYRRQYDAVTSLTTGQRLQNNGVNLQNEGYSTCISDGTSISDGMRVVLKHLSEKVKTLLRNDQTFMENVDKVVVSARVKEPYSIWKKMLRLQTRNVLDVPDAIALRVILDASKMCEQEDDDVRASRGNCLCYYVQKLFADNTDAGTRILRTKDYILNPKANEYQSLHFISSTFWNNQEWPFEMQIRTSDMHRTAEYGVAAHWDYKLRGNEKSGNNNPSISMSDLESQWVQLGREDDTQFYSKQSTQFEGAMLSKPNHSFSHYLERNQIRADINKARDEHLAPYIEALNAETNLAKESVFVFLSSEAGDANNGKVLSLPAGACVIDALRAGQIGVDFLRNGSVSISQNGIEANMTERLQNGDVLTIASIEM